MSTDKQNTAAEHKEYMQKTERELSDLLKQKRELSQKKESLFDNKRKISTFLNDTIADMRGYEDLDEIRDLERISGIMQSEFRHFEHVYEEEQRGIEKKRKQIELGREEKEREYRCQN